MPKSKTESRKQSKTESKEFSESELKPKRLSEPVLIAFFSGISYLFAYLYELGYTETFNIPSSLISITLNSVLTFGTIFLGGFLILTPIINFLLLFTGLNFPRVVKRRLSAYIFVLIFILIQAYLFGLENYGRWIFLFVFFLFFVILDFVFPLFFHRKGSYIQKLEAQESADIQTNDIGGLTNQYLGRDYLLLLIILFLGSSLARSAGVAEAIKQKDFLVTKSEPPFVILRIYDNNAIASTFNEDTLTVNNEFSIINLSTNPNLIMELREIGPLHSATSTPMVSPTPNPLVVTATATP